MASSLYGLHALESAKFWENMFQQGRLLQKIESLRRMRSYEHLVKFLRYSLHGQDTEPARKFAHSLQRIGNYVELQLRSAELGGETHRTKHSERIV